MQITIERVRIELLLRKTQKKLIIFLILSLPKREFMLRILYILIYLLANAYIIWRALRWLRHCHPNFSLRPFRIAFITVFTGMASLIVIAHLLEDHYRNVFIERLASQWFGILLYIIFYIAMADLIRVIIKLVIKILKKKPEDILTDKAFVVPGGLVVIALVTVCSIYGFIHVDDIQIQNYSVSIDKENRAQDNLRIVMVADQHLGFNMGAEIMEDMVEKINEANPDIVCFVGDIFDNNFDSLDDPEAIKNAWLGIESKYGVYACWGNHDVTEQLFSGFAVNDKSDATRDPRMDKLLSDSNIKTLGDELELIDDSFYLIGRYDYFNIGDGTNNRKTIEELMADVDKSKPVILMDHQPRELGRIADAGVDIDLSGHTHDGQLFPMNFTNRLHWENNYGMIEKGDMYSIVTSGVGVYGPAMRVGTNSEVVIVDVEFSK